MPNTRPLITDPLRSFKFNVNIPQTMGGALSGSMVRLGFMSMSGLGVSIEPITYREGGDNLTTRKMPGQADVNPLTFGRGLFAVDNDNWQWMSVLFTAVYGAGSAITTESVPHDFRTVVYINILEHPNNNTPETALGATYPNQNDQVKVSFKLYSAWIASLAYSDLDAGGNAVAVEQMTMNYEGFDMQWGGTGYVTNPVGW